MRHNVNGTTNSTISILTEKFNKRDLKECRENNVIVSNLIRELLIRRKKEGRLGQFAECKTINQMLLKFYNIKESYDTAIGWYNREYRIKPSQTPYFMLVLKKVSLTPDPYETKVLNIISITKLNKISYFLESQVSKEFELLKTSLDNVYNSHAPSVGNNGKLDYKKKSGKLKKEKGLPR